MANTIKMTIQFRRDLSANWEQYGHLVPAAGEPCFVIDKNILKIGDGVTPFKDLEPINGVKFELAADGKSLVLEDNILKLMGFDDAEVGAQPRKNADGIIEWVVPSTETVEGLKATVAGLQSDVASMQSTVTELREIVTPSAEGSSTLLERIESLEGKVGEDDVDAKIDAKLEAFASALTPDDNKVNTLMELINFVETHGKEAADMAAGIQALEGLVGTESVHDQITKAIENSGHMSKEEATSTLLSKVEAKAVFERVKYEIVSKPEGTIVDYRDKEIRVMCPADTKWVKQTVGSTGNANMYYMGFKAYAPDGAVSFKEGDQGVIADEMFDFNGDFAGIDEFGRKYSIVWFALASYDEASDTWTYFGKNSSTKKYIGWTYCVEWYDANGIVIESDKIRINLSNESCHNNIEPYYMTGYIKEVAVNGTLLDMIDGRVNVVIPEIKGSDEIEVAEDGTLRIKTISFDKIAQTEDDEIILNGGGAAG